MTKPKNNRKPADAPATDQPATDQPAPESEPAASPDAPPAPSSVQDLLPEVAADAAYNANPSAAAAALEPPAPPAESSPAEPTAPTPAPSSSSRTPLTGEVSPAPNAWSERTISRANRQKLGKRVKELQEENARLRVAGPPAGAPGAVLAPADQVAELETVLGYLFKGASSALEHFAGPEMGLDPDEQKVLAQTGAPAFLPRYAQVRASAPVLPFLAAVAGIIGPKVLVAMKRAQEKKRAQAAGEPEPSSSSAPGERPAAVVGTIEPAAPARPFGGPAE